MCGGRVWACNTLHVHDRGGSTVHSTVLLLVNYVDVMSGICLPIIWLCNTEHATPFMHCGHNNMAV